MTKNVRDRRAHRNYNSEEIKRRAKAIKKNRPKKKTTKEDRVMIILVVIVIVTIVAISFLFGIH